MSAPEVQEEVWTFYDGSGNSPVKNGGYNVKYLRADIAEQRVRDARVAVLREAADGIAGRMYSGETASMSPYQVGAHNARALEVTILRDMIAKEEQG